MASKASRVNIIDATATAVPKKTAAPRTHIKKTPKEVVESLPISAMAKKVESSKKSETKKSEFAEKVKAVTIDTPKKTKEVEKKIIKPAVKEKPIKKVREVKESKASKEAEEAVFYVNETLKKTASHIAGAIKKIKVKPRFIEVPEIRRVHMRVVAYVGVAYVVVGIVTASFALGNLFGGQKNFLLSVVPQMLTQYASVFGAVIHTDVAGTSPANISKIEKAPTKTSLRADMKTQAASVALASSVRVEEKDFAFLSAAPQASGTKDVSPDIEITGVGDKASGDVTLSIGVSDAYSVTLAMMPEKGLTAYYLGKARMASSSDSWSYAWNTHNVPNGDYLLVARVTNQFGTYESDTLEVSVKNTDVATSSPSLALVMPPEKALYVVQVEEEMMSTLVGKADEVEMVEASSTEEELALSLDEEMATTSVEKPEDIFTAEMDAFKGNVLMLIERFGVAYRAGDTDAQEFIKQGITLFKDKTLETLKAREVSVDGNYDVITRDLDSLITQEIARIETRERMIVERVGDSIRLDTDKDGVADYDEVHSFQTNPRLPDTDADGFTDGVEIVRGYDPLSARGETPIVFEYPEMHGVVRAETFSVESISTEYGEQNEVLGAHLEGKALPNSFVTLYLFSSPIVAVVRADEQGVWKHFFDADLEDGVHTAYAATTDNTGKIVAKSTSFSFIKSAEGFSKGGEVAPPVVVAETSDNTFTENGLFLLISALLVIILGLSLVALGAYFARPHKEDSLLKAA